MKNIKWSEVIENNYNEIINAIEDLEMNDYRFQVDLYVYPDGTTYEFTNVGGNSWLNDDHFVIWTSNHEYCDSDCYDSDGTFYIDRLDICTIVDAKIKQLKLQEM